MKNSCLRCWTVTSQKPRGPRAVGRLFVLACFVLLAGCASSPPKNPDNLCKVFQEKKSWWRAAKKAEKRWQLRPAVAMAFVQRESSYKRKAKPPKKLVLGFVPWGRISSAYGYAQATDGAWRDYQRATGRNGADRDDFGDALDFIGWYNAESRRQLKLKSTDARHLYLAYHEGWGGYRSGKWRKKTVVQGYADKVATRASRYERQLRGCRKRLDRRWRLFGRSKA